MSLKKIIYSFSSKEEWVKKFSENTLLSNSDMTLEAPEWINHGPRQPLHWRYESQFCSWLPKHGQTKEMNNKTSDQVAEESEKYGKLIHPNSFRG